MYCGAYIRTQSLTLGSYIARTTPPQPVTQTQLTNLTARRSPAFDGDYRLPFFDFAIISSRAIK
jgi:hypothetical protein